MYNKESIIFDINMLTKIICYLLFIIFVFINKNIYLFIIIESLILIETRKEKISTKFNLATILLLLLSLMFNKILIIPKLLIIVAYTYLLTKVINLKQLRYLIEVTFYKYKNNKLTKLFLKLIYYVRYINIYTEKYQKLRMEYGINLTPHYRKFAIKKAHKLTKMKIQELVKMNEIRFYNYYNKKTYMEKIKFEKLDYCYLFIHIIILVISYF